MKVSELMNPKGVLLYAKIDNSADALGILDLRRWAGEWDQALADALGVSLGESESSSKPSSGSTGRPSRSTSAGSRKSR